MSRSTKKHGWVKDGASRRNSGPHFFKKRANRAVRRYEGELPEKGRFFKRLTNPYDIHDFVCQAREKGSDETSYRDWMK